MQPESAASPPSGQYLGWHHQLFADPGGPSMIRLGMLDFDTSHCVEFTRRLNRRGSEPDQWVEGAEVVLACPGDSRMAPERIPGFRREMEELGVPLVDRPADLIGRVDGVLVESLEGGVHLERARPFLEAGLPCFIDKPFTCTVADARALVELARRHGAPLFSSSALRYAPELVAYKSDRQRGDIVGVVTHGPALAFPSHAGRGNPGLFHYGIHALEALYALMGPGCVRVHCTPGCDVDVVVGHWRDGRVGVLRGARPRSSYGFLAFTAEQATHVAIDTRYLYRELLVQVVRFFASGVPPVDPAETVEVMAFMESALHSAGRDGAGEMLQV